MKLAINKTNGGISYYYSLIRMCNIFHPYTYCSERFVYVVIPPFGAETAFS